MEKTNVMRLFDKAKISYVPHEYDKKAVNGEEVASLLNEEEGRCFKTLVTVSDKNEHFVFVVPVCAVLNLKKAAKAVGAKKIEMIKQKELFPLTGYIHGGCSPVGMKKPFHTVIDRSAEKYESIFYSAGKIGFQVETSPFDLKNYILAEFADIAENP